MIACVLCRGDTELDDVVRDVDVGCDGPIRWCVCLRCHDRRVGGRRPVPPTLRREVTEVLASAGGRPSGPDGG